MEASRDQSEFNFALSFLNRLNTWFYAASEAAISLDPFNWFHALMIIRRELSDDMKAEELVKANEYKTIINQMLPRAMQKVQFSGNKEISSDLYEQLDSFEIFLRGVVKSAGYKSKFKEDPRFAIYQ